MNKKEYINKFCVGCGGCHSVLGTEMKENEKGFPTVDINGISDSKLYEKICPVFNYTKECKQDVWGVVEKAYVGYSTDKEIRYKASSGGAITEICMYLLEEKLVDGIIHIRYNPENPTTNISCISKTVEELKSRCGSRYSISVPLYDILNVVESGKKYAFVGKPCDVMVVRNLMNIDLQLKSQIYCLISFFCAGEPSVTAQNELLKTMNCTIDDCKEITYRGNGWPGYTTVIRKDGSISKLEYKEAWGRYLGRDLRDICRFCLDGTGDAADIVCADFWYLDEKDNPDFSEHEGRNIIITRTERGTVVTKNVISKGRLVIMEDFTDKMNSLHKYQPHQYKRKGTMSSMISAMRLCGREVPRYSRTYLRTYASHLPLMVRCRYFAGIIKRVIRGKL